jgi:HlyD family secretion protein
MDRPVDPNYNRKRLARRIAVSLLLSLTLFALFAWGPAFISPSVSRSRLRTGLVTIGPIEATITASGTVVPEFEQVLAAPVDARAVRVVKRPGDTVRRGDTIVELDVSDSLSAIKTIDDKLAIKANEQNQLRISLENTLIGLRGQLEVMKLEARSFELQAEQNRKLRGENLISDEELRRSEVQRDKAVIELGKLEEQLEGRDIEMSILKQERQDKERLLARATTQSDRDGVLTWVLDEVGSIIRQGSVIARVADLNSFRVHATLSDVHASRLSAGMPVRVRINETYLEGTVASVLPTIKDGVMTVVIALKDKWHAQLRSNLRVDVYLVSGHKDRTLKVKRGPAIPGEGHHHLFVLRDNLAIKTPVQIGLSSFDEAEIVSGLMEGDEVVVSDMTDHMHRQEIKIR